MQSRLFHAVVGLGLAVGALGSAACSGREAAPARASADTEPTEAVGGDVPGAEVTKVDASAQDASRLEDSAAVQHDAHAHLDDAGIDNDGGDALTDGSAPDHASDASFDAMADADAGWPPTK